VEVSRRAHCLLPGGERLSVGQDVAVGNVRPHRVVERRQPAAALHSVSVDVLPVAAYAEIYRGPLRSIERLRHTLGQETGSQAW